MATVLLTIFRKQVYDIKLIIEFISHNNVNCFAILVALMQQRFTENYTWSFILNIFYFIILYNKYERSTHKRPSSRYKSTRYTERKNIYLWDIQFIHTGVNFISQELHLTFHE